MAAAMQKMSEWEEKYYDIGELYALNDALLATVPDAADPESQIELIGALVETIGESADILTEEYICLCAGRKNRNSSKARVEGALRKIYMGINQFSHAMRDARNAALAVVKKIKRQLEQVISNFMEFVVLSLDKVMQKHDIDELKQRHAHIALMLHQHQLGQQGA